MRLAHDVDNVLQVLWLWLRLRAPSGDPDLLEAVALGEVPERLVARDDLVPDTVGKPISVLAVERPKLGDQTRSSLGIVERATDALDDQRKARRVEPNVGVPIVEAAQAWSVEQQQDLV